ncbi:MAG: molybdenum cofactor guanylyltransferase [Thermoplasmatota archaeon]
MTYLSGVLLAGGASSRLGEDKAFVELGGRSLLARGIDALFAVDGVAEVVVAAGDDARVARIADITWTHRVRAVADARRDAGPLAGLWAALEALRTDVALVAPVDAPFLSAAGFTPLLAALPRHDGAIYTGAHGIEPLHLVLDRARALPAVARAARAGGGPRDAYKSLDLAHVDAGRAPPNFFFSINTREELEEARRIAHK